MLVLLPAFLCEAQPCRYYILLSGPKMGFTPRRGDTLPSAVHSPVPNFTFIGAEVWEYSPQTVKISNFGHKFAPQG